MTGVQTCALPISIEPSPVNFQILTNNVESQNTSNVMLYNIAAGEKDGNVRFLIYEGAGNSCMVIPDGTEPRWPGKLIDVSVRKMDSFLQEIGINKIDFVRMDVEGYEKNVLDGLKQTLQQSKPIIHIEVHVNIMGKENTLSMFQNLKDLGYDVTAYVPREIDTPIIGTMKDVRNYNMDKIMKMIQNNENPSFLMLTLENHG